MGSVESNFISPFYNLLHARSSLLACMVAFVPAWFWLVFHLAIATNEHLAGKQAHIGAVASAIFGYVPE